jgi:low affinity Fe/Cu permease
MMTFAAVARSVERTAGSAWAFLAACASIVVWALMGPIFGWSDTWQITINTITTIVTFLMVFLIQNSQTRDTAAIHLKLDELLRVNKEARNEVIAAEELDKDTIDRAHAEMQDLAIGCDD